MTLLLCSLYILAGLSLSIFLIERTDITGEKIVQYRKTFFLYVTIFWPLVAIGTIHDYFLGEWPRC